MAEALESNGIKIDRKKEALLRVALSADEPKTQSQLARDADIKPATAQHHIDEGLKPADLVTTSKPGEHQNSPKLIEATEYAEGWFAEHEEELEKPRTLKEAIEHAQDAIQEAEATSEIVSGHDEKLKEVENDVTAIASSVKELEKRLSGIESKIDGTSEDFEDDINRLNDRQQSLINRINSLENTVSSLAADVDENSSNFEKHRDRLDSRLRSYKEDIAKELEYVEKYADTRHQAAESYTSRVRNDLTKRLNENESTIADVKAIQRRSFRGRLKWLLLGR